MWVFVGELTLNTFILTELLGEKEVVFRSIYMAIRNGLESEPKIQPSLNFGQVQPQSKNCVSELSL